jgi:glucans biosynthesis protein
MWIPEKSPKPGDRLEFNYRQHWTMDEDPSDAGGHVVATRTGVHEWQPEQRTMIVEFEGERLVDKDGKMPEAVVEAVGVIGTKVKIEGIAVQPMSKGRVRLAFQIRPAEEGGKLSEIGSVELKASLKRGEDFLTETWLYRIKL